jgi:hypothetical protein
LKQGLLRPATRTATATASSSFSLQFDGTNDIARTVNLPLWSQFTLEAWVQRTADSGTYQTFLSDANSTYSQVMFTLYVDGGNGDCGGSPSDQFAFYDLIFAQNRLPIIEVMSVVTVSSAKIGHSDFAKGNRHHERRTEYH